MCTESTPAIDMHRCRGPASGARPRCRAVGLRVASARARAVVVTAAGAAVVAAPAHAAELTERAGAQLAHLVSALLVIACVAVGLTASALVVSVLTPGRVRRAGRVLEQSPGLTFIAGILFTLAAIFALAITGQLPGPLPALVGTPLLLLLVLVGLTGVTAVMHALGDRIHSNIRSPRAGSSFHAVLLGGGGLCSAALLPVAGWIILTIAGVLAIGAGLLALLARSKTPPVPVPEDSGGREDAAAQDDGVSA